MDQKHTAWTKIRHAKVHAQWGLYYYYHTMAKCLSLLGVDEVVDANGQSTTGVP